MGSQGKSEEQFIIIALGDKGERNATSAPVEVCGEKR